ncbi:MAG: RNA polymerase subunit sigma-70, partial [Planctomycetales bacterium]|nr:RNA polymerase subunit sigma-70 [Planctomycetales bacterium]
MPGHLQRLCSPPLLSPEQEVRLFRRMNYLKYRANVLRSQIRAADADPRQLDRVDSLIRTGEEVRNQIVHANVRLVMSIAKKFADNRSSFDDLLSEGISSLIRAVEKFDYSRGFRFSTYATSVVRRD